MNTSPPPDTLNSLVFDNRYVRSLPADPETGSRRRQVSGACYSRVRPRPAAAPALAACWTEVAELIGIDESATRTRAFAETFCGNRLLPGMDPISTCYGGHQFGNWAGQLGDGRAINLGELVNHQGERWTLQLKGAGPTPYSRSADGLAVLRSSIREFLCSEAMYHLGVPTTRALSLCLTGETVIRDMLYDGHPAPEPGAVVCRVAPSFTRFGHFEILAARGEVELLRQFADFTIRTDFPHLKRVSEGSDADAYLSWFDEVCRRTVDMIVHWQRVGFVHGVMNTDNMSILGLTIDYGPYGWLEDYDPGWTPNTTDAAGRRYRFGNQPSVALWNLLQLANAIYPLVEDAAALEAILQDFQRTYTGLWQATMAAKLGLNAFEPATDARLVDNLFDTLALTETDMTVFFRKLSALDPTAPGERQLEVVEPAFYTPAQITADVRTRILSWLAEYAGRLRADGVSPERRKTRMNAVNPRYVLRNYRAQLVIDAAEQGSLSELHELMDVLRHPYDDQPGRETYAEKRPDWARSRVGCSMLSCSS